MFTLIFILFEQFLLKNITLFKVSLRFIQFKPFSFCYRPHYSHKENKILLPYLRILVIYPYRINVDDSGINFLYKFARETYWLSIRILKRDLQSFFQI